MLKHTQHLNNILLSVGEHHTLSIAQYSADTFCEVMLYDNRINRPVKLPKLYTHSDAVSYTTDNFSYVRADDLAEIINAAHEYIEKKQRGED